MALTVVGCDTICAYAWRNLRTGLEHTPIFERAVNAGAELQPGIRFCFNDSPENMLDAVRRGITR